MASLPIPQDKDVFKPGPGAGDRRRVCRYPVVLQSAFLGWYQESRFTQTPVRLVDLSLNGCRLELAQLPGLSARQAVWVHLAKGSHLDWIEGQIISVSKPLLQKCAVRIKFNTTLGYEPFKQLIYGPGHLRDRIERAVPEHERDEFWR